MNIYRITLKHDGGTVNITTTARRVEPAEIEQAVVKYILTPKLF